MRRMMLITSILVLLSVSCSLIAEEGLSAQPQGDTSTATKQPTRPQPTATKPTPTIVPTSTREATPSSTPEPESSDTPSPTIEGAPSVTVPPLTAGQDVTITEIKMIDSRTGWGIGHQDGPIDHILYTNDGGETWENRSPPVAPLGAEAESKRAWGHFADAQTAWVIFSEEGPPPLEPKLVWRSDDGGQTWQVSKPLQLSGDEPFFTPEELTFVDREHGWLLVHVDAGMSHDYSYLYATQDGGANWERIVDPYKDGLQSLHNTGMAFANTRLGWVTKDNLGVLQGAFFEATRDGGDTWEDKFLPAPPELDWFNEISQCITTAPTFLTPNRAALIVKCKTPGENDPTEWTHTYIYTTGDRGETWEHDRLPSPVEDLIFIDAQTGWGLGRDIYTTTDGGLSWVEIKHVNWDGQFSFVDEQTGWAVARDDGEIALVMTTNGGETWKLVEPKMASREPED